MTVLAEYYPRGMRSKVLMLVGLVALFGCDEHNPPAPPGGIIPPGSGGADGSPGSADAAVNDARVSGATITGFICLVVDPRNALECPTETALGDPLDLSGITIAEVGGTASTTSQDDGSFSLNVTDPDSVLLLVTHASLRATAMRVAVTGPITDILLPSMELGAWTNLVNTLGVLEAANHGAAAVYVFELVGLEIEPVIGAEVIQPAGSTYAPFYDRTTAYDWTQNGLTGDLGAAMLFGVPVPSNQTSFSVIGPGGSPNLDNLPLDIRDATTTIWLVNL